MNESCHPYEWVTSHIWMSHVTRINAVMWSHDIYARHAYDMTPCGIHADMIVTHSYVRRWECAWSHVICATSIWYDSICHIPHKYVKFVTQSYVRQWWECAWSHVICATIMWHGSICHIPHEYVKFVTHSYVRWSRSDCPIQMNESRTWRMTWLDMAYSYMTWLICWLNCLSHSNVTSRIWINESRTCRSYKCDMMRHDACICVRVESCLTFIRDAFFHVPCLIHMFRYDTFAHKCDMMRHDACTCVRVESCLTYE